MKRMFVVLLVLSAFAVAQTKTRYVRTPYVSPDDGAALYATHCESCHGGMAAAPESAEAVHLTTLAKRNGGVYPAGRVLQVIKQGARHGETAMPGWERPLVSSHGDRSFAKMAIVNLARYIEEHQQK